MRISSFITGRRLVSLPFSDFCDPFFQTIEDSSLLQNELISYAKKNKLDYIEFRSSDMKFPSEPIEFRTDLRHILFLVQMKMNYSVVVRIIPEETLKKPVKKKFR